MRLYLHSKLRMRVTFEKPCIWAQTYMPQRLLAVQHLWLHKFTQEWQSRFQSMHVKTLSPLSPCFLSVENTSPRRQRFVSPRSIPRFKSLAWTIDDDAFLTLDVQVHCPYAPFGDALEEKMKSPSCPLAGGLYTILKQLPPIRHIHVSRAGPMVYRLGNYARLTTTVVVTRPKQLMPRMRFWQRRWNPLRVLYCLGQRP